MKSPAVSPQNSPRGAFNFYNADQSKLKDKMRMSTRDFLNDIAKEAYNNES